MVIGSPDAPPAPRFLWVWLWLLLGATALFCGRQLFHVPVYEEGDDAANALNIDRAKHGRELHGNYSRFNFNHPGPAFFYTYAAGEIVLCDLLSIAPARHNAHLLAGALLQCFFIAAACSLLAGLSPHPVRMALILAAAALLQLAFIPTPFFSVWPPFVLAMPFACSVISAALVSLGRWHALPWFILSAGFLVHGHVAQPLFAGIFAACAAIPAWRLLKATPRNFPEMKTLWISGALVAAFALPLVLDLFAGRSSNAYRILLHIAKFPSEGRPGWFTAIGSTFSYFGYCIRQEHWFSATGTGTWMEFWQDHGAGLIVSACVASATVALTILHRRDASPTIAAARRVALFAAIALVVSVFWARRQDGGVTFYNSHFLFGLMWVLLVPTLLILIQKRPKIPGWLAPPFFAACAAFLVTRASVDAAGIGSRARKIDRNLTRLLASWPTPQAPKGLVFDWDNWFDTVTIAAALQRHGIDFRVLPSWRIMFGRQHVLQSSENLAQTGRLEWWTLVRTREARAGDVPLGEEASLGRQPPPALPAWPAILEFQDGGNASPYRYFGITGPEKSGAMTEASIAILRFDATPRPTDVDVVFRASSVRVSKWQGPTMPVRVFLNHTLIGEFSVGPQREDQVMRVPTEVWNRAATAAAGAELLIEIPEAKVPSEVRWSGDHRQLGLALHSIAFQDAP